MSPPTPSKLLRAAAILDMPVETLRERLDAPSTSDHTPSGEMAQVSGQQNDTMNTMLAQSVEEQCTQIEDLSHSQDQTEFTNFQAGQLDLGTRFSPQDFSVNDLNFQLIGCSEKNALDYHDIGNIMNGIGEASHINSSESLGIHTTLENSSRNRARGADIDMGWPPAETLRGQTIETHIDSTRRASTNTTSSLIILAPSSSANSTLPHPEPTPSSFVPIPSSSGNSAKSSETRSLTLLEPSVGSREADDALIQEAAMLGPCTRVWNIPPVS